jgi:V/A-type H+/Na+-transporting ATPase subunit C
MDYLAISGRIKFRETKFLTAGFLDNLAAAKSFEDFAGMLENGNFSLPHVKTSDELINFFENNLTELMQEMEDNLPASLFSFFTLKYDYHNLKLISAGKTGKEDKNYSLFSAVDFFTLKAAAETGNRREIPSYLREALDIAIADKNPAEKSLAFKKNYCLSAREILEGENSPFLNRYLKILIDFSNISIFIQKKDSGAKMEEKNLTAGGNIAKNVYGSEEDLWKKINTQYHIDTPLTAENFDKQKDKAVMAFIKDARVMPSGIEVIFAYFLAREIELNNVRRLSIGKFYSVDEKQLKDWILPPYQYT